MAAKAARGSQRATPDVLCYLKQRPPGSSTADSALSADDVLVPTRILLSDKPAVEFQQKQYSFDGIASPETAPKGVDVQDHLTELMLPDILSEAREGRNVIFVCYGRTGSGKTYAMNHVAKRIAEGLFKADGRAVTVTSFEIQAAEAIHLLGSKAGHPIEARIWSPEDAFKKLEPLPAKDSRELYDLFVAAAEKRCSRPTVNSPDSSRSHLFFRIKMAGSIITLVDLAGCEDPKATGEKKTQRERGTNTNSSAMKEGTNINLSLLELRQCINALRKRKHVNWRRSLLTHFLKACLETNAVQACLETNAVRIRIVACISPFARDCSETVQTLSFASEARKIDLSKMTIRSKSKMDQSALIAEKDREISDLTDCARGLETRIETLQCSMDELEIRNDELESRIEELGKCNEELKGNVRQFCGRMEAAEARNTELGARVTELEEAAASSATELGDLLLEKDSSLAELREQFAAAQLTVTYEREHVLRLEQQVANLQDLLSQTQLTVTVQSEEIALLEREAANLQDRLSGQLVEKDAVIAELRKDFAGLQSTSNSQKEDVVRLEQQLTDLQRNLSDQLAEKDDFIGNLQEQTETAKSTMKSQRKDLARLEQEAVDLQDRFSSQLDEKDAVIAELQKNFAGSQSIVASQSEEVAQLQQQVADLQTCLSKQTPALQIPADTRALERTVEELRQKLADAECKIELLVEKEAAALWVEDVLDDLRKENAILTHRFAQKEIALDRASVRENDERMMWKDKARRKDKEIENLVLELNEEKHKVQHLKLKLRRFRNTSSNSPRECEEENEPSQEKYPLKEEFLKESDSELDIPQATSSKNALGSKKLKRQTQHRRAQNAAPSPRTRGALGSAGPSTASPRTKLKAEQRRVPATRRPEVTVGGALEPEAEQPIVISSDDEN